MIDIQPGDLLLYWTGGPEFALHWRAFARIVRAKTGTALNHAEVAISATKTVSAWADHGVSYYPLRQTGLTVVARPVVPFDLPAALSWFDRSANGQMFDYLGLLRFFAIGKQSLDKQFCSEVCVRFYRAGGLDPLPGVDADLVDPGRFLLSRAFEAVWWTAGFLARLT